MFLRTWPIRGIPYLSVEKLHTLNARCSYGFEVTSDAFPTDAAIEKVEPSLRVEDAVRMEEGCLVIL